MRKNLFDVSRASIALSSALLFVVLQGCGDTAAPPAPDPNAPSTWKTIRDDVLATRCTTCHVAGSTFATQSNLVLTADAAYDHLVDAPASNAAAHADGLLRVGKRGLESLATSYLWKKIYAPDQEHLYIHTPQYGALMPLGEQPLTNGQLEYIRQWIVAGAPSTGDVADRAVLGDMSR